MKDMFKQINPVYLKSIAGAADLQLYATAMLDWFHVNEESLIG